MWVSDKVFMQLVERVAIAERKAEEALQEAKKKAEPSVVVKPKGGNEDEESLMLKELMHGVTDEKAGRVIYTDGTD